MLSLKAPFRLDGGGIGVIEDPARIAEQKIINCLTTGRYERVGLPQYGAGASRLVLDNIDELVERDFATDAIEEINSSVSGVTILDVRVRPDRFDITTALITVSFKTPLTAIRAITFGLSLNQVLTEESAI